METSKDNLSPGDYIIKLAKEHGDTYTDIDKAKIAAKGFGLGYHQAMTEKNIEIKRLAQMVKLLLPGIYHIPNENVMQIQELSSTSEEFKDGIDL